ncbi:MAG TPA: carboxypeptidase-like regulatory domain-containing protein [Polyangia bacterium]
MRIPSSRFHIKPTALLLILAAGPWSACTATIAQAPFPARPDTVVPGDLLGEFDGRVVDATSGKPIAGAIVQASWAFETGRGLTAPAGGSVTTVATDNDGRYLVDRLTDLPTARARVAAVTLVVYERGYVAYRSDRVFDNALGGARARTDFAQHQNVVKLDRWSGALSHVKHVRFVGGSGALKRALGSEVVEASLELTSGPKKASTATEPERETAPPLDATPLLSVDELRAVTGYTGELAVEKLTDLPTTSSYDSRHFKAVGKAETFDAALRVWKLAPDAAGARFAKLLAEVPHAERKDEMGTGSLRGFDGRIVAVAAFDHARGVVIELTCGLDQCRDADQAAALLKRVLARADRLGQPAPPPVEPVEEGKPTEPARPEPPKTEEPPADQNPFQLKPPELKR